MQNILANAKGRLSLYLVNRHLKKHKMLSRQRFSDEDAVKYPGSPHAIQLLRLKKSVERVSGLAGIAEPKTVMLLDAKFNEDCCCAKPRDGDTAIGSMEILFSCALPEKYGEAVLDAITAHEIAHMLGIKKQVKADEYSARLLGTGKGLLEYLEAKSKELAEVCSSMGWTKRMVAAIHTREPTLMPKTIFGRLIARIVFVLKSDNASLYKRIGKLRELENELDNDLVLRNRNRPSEK
jgi:hypothetical protein